MDENDSVNQYDNDDVSMSIKTEPEVVFEVDDNVNWTSEHYILGNEGENDESSHSKSDDNDYESDNKKCTTLEQVITKLGGLTKEIRQLKRILLHQNEMISNMIAQNSTFHTDNKAMKESVKQQDKVISHVVPQEKGSLKKVLKSHLKPPTYKKMFPVETQYEFDQLESFINDKNKSEVVAAVKHIVNPKGLRYSMEFIISKEILLHYNIDGKFNKKRLLDYKNILDVIFLATLVEGRPFPAFIEDLRNILRFVKNKHFKLICLKKKKIREEIAIQHEPET